MGGERREFDAIRGLRELRELASLVRGEGAAAPANVRYIPVDLIDPNPHQTRVRFDVSDLVRSIRKRGVIEPIGVVPRQGRYQLIFGERRLRAAREVGLKEVPCVVFEGLDDAVQAEISYIENVHRKDLAPAERCLAVLGLLERGYSPEEIAELSSVTVQYVYQMIKAGRWLREAVELLGPEGAAPLFSPELEMSDLLRLSRTVGPEGAVEALERGVRGEVPRRPHLISVRRVRQQAEDLVRKVSALAERELGEEERELLAEVARAVEELRRVLRRLLREAGGA